VIDLTHGQPVILVGHSIGGMTTLTFCRLFPEALRTRVAGLVLVHTTYTNPVRTTTLARLNTLLERPVLVPLLHLMIWLAPLVRVMNWLSYLNGSSHLSTKLSGFAGTETWQQVDFVSRYGLYLSPAVLARGCLGCCAMMRPQPYRPFMFRPSWSRRIAIRCANQKPASASAGMSQPPSLHRSYRRSIWALWNTTHFAALVHEFAEACFHAAPLAETMTDGSMEV
jgi:pimeloyl-ACP methyl ester carboxylesterase